MGFINNFKSYYMYIIIINKLSIDASIKICTADKDSAVTLELKWLKRQNKVRAKSDLQK